MIEWLRASVESRSPLLLPLVFAAGLTTSLNPCVYPMFAAVAGYVWAQGRGRIGRNVAIACTFLVGLGLIYAALGAIAGGFAGTILGLGRGALRALVGAICIAAGIFMADLLPVSVGFNPVGQVWRRAHGLPGAFLMGTLMGLVATPCATPVLVLILSAGAASRSAAFAAMMLFVYAIGHSLPVLAVAVASGALSALDRAGRYTKALQTAGGWLVVGLGIYLLWLA